MNIQTDASKITQAELDHIHRMTKIARVGRINAQARAEKMRKQVSILREALAELREALAELCDSQLSSRDRESAIANGLSALEATKEGD